MGVVGGGLNEEAGEDALRARKRGGSQGQRGAREEVMVERAHGSGSELHEVELLFGVAPDESIVDDLERGFRVAVEKSRGTRWSV